MHVCSLLFCLFSHCCKYKNFKRVFVYFQVLWQHSHECRHLIHIDFLSACCSVCCCKSCLCLQTIAYGSLAKHSVFFHNFSRFTHIGSHHSFVIFTTASICPDLRAYQGPKDGRGRARVDAPSRALPFLELQLQQYCYTSLT